MIDRLNRALDGRYRIERELGEGGMATVYLAEDLKHDRSVALKVLKPELAAVVGAERFLAEINHGEPPARAHPAAVRFRRGGRVPFLRDAVHRGRELPGDAGPGAPAARGRGGGADPAGGGCAPARPRPGEGPSVWSPSGDALYYESGETGVLFRVDVEVDPTFRVLRRTVLDDDGLVAELADMHPDGRRLLVTRSTTVVSNNRQAGRSLVVVANWLMELDRRMGRERGG